jgi:hypothetical protein
VTASTRRAFLERAGLVAGSLAGFGGLGALSACSGANEDRSAARTTNVPASSTTRAASRTAIARDAFLAGVPLVVTVRTLQTFAPLLGVNRLLARRVLTDPTSHFVVAPNRDTVYVLAVLDLRAGPQVLTVPAIPDRYHVFQFLDAWMGDFGLFGTRTNGGRGGSWVIVPPGATPKIPRGYATLECPTMQAFVLGRVRAVDDADAARAGEYGAQMRLTPLEPGGPAVPAMPKAPGTPQSVGGNGIGFFDELGDALVLNPPVTREQRAAIASAAVVGVGTGKHPSTDRGSDRAALRHGVRDGLAALADRSLAGAKRVHGWDVNLGLGTDDTNTGLHARAVVARYFWGPVPAAEAVYPRAALASDGEPLDGSKRYRIHFARGQTPPVDAFWSLTVYGPDLFLVPNPANRYSVSGDTRGLVTNPDGSIDVFLQADPPAGHEANWLPVPRGPFELIMRLYLPRAPILDGTYDYPPVMVVS